MMGRIRAGAASLLFLVAAFVSSPQPVRAEVPTGALYVTTLPSGADIWIDGTYVGRAPVLLDALSPGHHSMTITKAGWVVQEVDVNVPAGTTLMSSTHLVAGPRALAGDASGTLVIRNLPPGTPLEIDGTPYTGAAGQGVALPAGRHRLTATFATGKTSRSITVLPDTATDVVLIAPKSGIAQSSIVAPAEDYLPTNNFSLEGKKVVVHWGGHVVVGYLGEPTLRIDGANASYGGVPQSIDGRLYLPLALLEKLAGDASNTR